MTAPPQPLEGSTATFADLGVEQVLCDALTDIGITNPFPIQEVTLPLALSGADVIGQARTGTGKTLAFGLPLLQRIDPGERRTVALVVVPTRELCVQVRDDLAQAASHKGVAVVALYGGRSIDPQVDALRGGAPVVVGTPGRLLDLQQRRALDLSGVTSLVLDEADEMLDLGFLPDVERLIESTAGRRQTLLFSATMPSAVVALARRYMSKPTFLRADVEESRIAPATRQFFFSCHRMDKPAVLARILQAPERGLCVVFTRTKRMADILASELRDRGINAAPIHSDLRQESRERALKRFREGKIDVLVATEVAARGLDIDDVTHVVNYDTPDDEKMYLHRIGRTGRAGAAGVAITLAVWNELARVEMIKRALDVDEPTHEVFSTSDILDDLFDLPPRERRAAASAADWNRAVGRGRRSPGGRAARDDGGDGKAGARGQRPAGGSSRGGRSGGGKGREGVGSPGPTAETGDRGGERAAGDRAPGQRAGARGEHPRPPAAASGGPAPDPGDAAERRRVRRRTRARSGAGGGTAAAANGRGEASEPAESAPEARRAAPGAGEDSAGAATRRVRRRTVRGDGSSAREEGGDERRPAARGEGRRSPAQQQQRRGRDGDDTRRRSKQRGDGGGQRVRPSGSAAQGGGRGGDRRAPARRGRPDGSRSSRTSPRNSTQVDPKEARGDGRPRLRRPLEVVHLP